MAGLLHLGASPGGVVAFQILLAAFTCALVAYAATILVHSEWVGWAAGLTLALDLPSTLSACLLMTETLCALLVILGFLSLITQREGAAGILSGLTLLCRPAALLLPPIWALASRTMRGFFILLTMTAIVIAPWLIRNWTVLGESALSTIAGVNLLKYRAAGVLALTEGISLEEAGTRLQARLPKEGSALQKDRDRRKLAMEILRAHPWETLRIHVGALDNLLIRPERRGFDLALGTASDKNTSNFTWGLVLFQMAHLTVAWGTFVLGLRVLWKAGMRRVACLLLGGIIAFVLVSLGPESYARFRVPFMPLVAIGAGIGLGAWLRARDQKIQVPIA